VATLLPAPVTPRRDRWTLDDVGCIGVQPWKNGWVAVSPTSQAERVAAARDESDQVLRHAMVIGGTLDEWATFGDDRWGQRVDQLGAVVGRAGASFLSIRPFDAGSGSVTLDGWERTVDGCMVLIDPCGDGRQRLAEALASIAASDPINEATIGEALYAPADCEPDLIVVLGPPTRLPPSAVWELAYGELVFLPLEWDELGGDHLLDAMADFARRERRFGGVDL